MAHLGDSVAYARAYPVQANCPRPDTLYAASRTGPAERLPHAADRLDTTRQVLLRLSLHQLRHSPNPASYCWPATWIPRPLGITYQYKPAHQAYRYATI